MAIFQPSAIVGSVSGNVGGISFANPRGSKVIRKARRPTANAKASQLKAQTVFANAARKWRTLDAETREAWNQYAAQNPRPNKLGVTRALTGYQAWVQLETFAEPNGGILNDLPPIASQAEGLTNWSLAASLTGTWGISFDETGSPGGHFAHIYAANLYRETIPSTWNDFAFLLAHNTLGTFYGLSTVWENALPLPQVGSVIAVKVIPTTVTAKIPFGAITLFTIVTA